MTELLASKGYLKVLLHIACEELKALIGICFGVPFALIPLAMVTSSKRIMGEQTNHKVITYIVWGIAGVVSLLNIVLIWLTIQN